MSKQPRNFQLPLKNITTSFNASNMTMSRGGYPDLSSLTNSPMSNLTFNLSELSTGRNPPRRKLSLSNVSKPTVNFGKSDLESPLTVESAQVIWSPLVDSPALASSISAGSCLGFDIETGDSLSYENDKSLGEHAGGKLYSDDACSQDSGLGLEQDRRNSFDDAASMSSLSSSLSITDRLPSLEDVWNTLDSPNFKTPKGKPPKRSRSLMIDDRQIFEDTCSPIKYSPIKSLSQPQSSFSKALFSPQILEAATEKSEGHRFEVDDGFQELFKLDDGHPAATRWGLHRSHSLDVRLRPSSKRCEPPSDGVTPVQTKKWRGDDDIPVKTSSGIMEDKLIYARRFHRCHSETEAMIKSAISRMFSEPDLIGDCSKTYCLPTISGRHQDLKSISSGTLSRLMGEEFCDIVEEFHVIDCRYPYEFEGGHIQNALNIYTKEKIIEKYIQSPLSVKDSNKRMILIFHCEFSSERGPGLYRFLRRQDREANKERYPFLHYPEIYLLEGGYKNFFEHFAHLCEPRKYMTMLDKNHSEDLRKFRAKCKSWSDDRSQTRTGVRNLKF